MRLSKSLWPWTCRFILTKADHGGIGGFVPWGHLVAASQSVPFYLSFFNWCCLKSRLVTAGPSSPACSASLARLPFGPFFCFLLFLQWSKGERLSLVLTPGIPLFRPKLCSWFHLHQGTTGLAPKWPLLYKQNEEITFVESSSEVHCHLIYGLSCPAYFMCLIILQIWVTNPHFKRYSLSWNNYRFFPVLYLIL